MTFLFKLKKGRNQRPLILSSSLCVDFPFGLYASGRLFAHWSHSSLSWPTLSLSSHALIPQTFTVYKAHFIGYFHLNSPDKWRYFLSSRFWDSQERMLIVRFIFKVVVQGLQAGLPCCHAFIRCVSEGYCWSDHGKQISPTTSLGDMLHPLQSK